MQLDSQITVVSDSRVGFEKVVSQVKRVKQKEKVFCLEILSFRNITFLFAERRIYKVPKDRHPEIRIDVSEKLE